VDPGPGETWATLAVRGGVSVPARLGSRSWDSLSQLGPPPLRIGDRVAVGPDPRTPVGELAPPAPLDPVVDVTIGPRADWFTDEAIATLLGAEWTVSSDLSRVGVRLIGPILDRTEATIGRELPSEGLVTGAIQVPPSGQPIVMLADHPTTGGYPVIAVVDDDQLAKVVRRRPGDTLRFRRRG
jgi:allophanate hydrolase subunit 2